MFDIVLSVEEGGAHAQAHVGGRWTRKHALGAQCSVEALKAFTSAVDRAARCGKAFDKALLTTARALHEALFQNDLGDALTYTMARTKGPVPVRIVTDDARLQRVPWEALCKPGTSEEFLGTGSRVYMVRGVTSTWPVEPQKVEGPLRILVIAPQSDATTGTLKFVLQPFLSAGTIEWLDPPITGERATAARIFERLRKERPHILHFIGHGGIDADGHATLRLVDDEYGDEVWLKAERLAQELKASIAGELRLVVLESCEGAAPGALGSTADIFVRAGVEAVVSYLWPVRAEPSRNASKAFYETLLTTQGDVVASVCAARRTLLADDGPAFALVAHVHGASPVVFDFSTRKAASNKAPFVVPFPQDKRFLGRDDDLKKLHVLLQADAAIGVGAVTGMGGIGKTQLAVEYAYRYREAYPGGVYWVNAARDWQEEFARLAGKVGIRDQSASEYERLRWLVGAFVEYLEKHPKSLLIFDNVEDPLELHNRSREFVPADLPCKLLFTTRRQSDAFPMVEIRSLDDDSALRLLLDTSTRKHLLQQGDQSTARSICRTLGNLPLAIALASAYLEKRPNVPFQAYLEGLVGDGALRVMDGAKVDPRQLPTQHTQGLRATLQEQWLALRDDGDARAVLQTASLLGEAEQIPRARLSLLTGLADERSGWRDPPLDEALRELSEWSLVETLSESAIRLHPLVREFAVWRLGVNREAFTAACAARMADALYDMERLSHEVEHRGIDAVLSDVRAGVLLGTSNARRRLETLQRPLDREAHMLRLRSLREMPGFFLQQLRNRCFELGLETLWQPAEDKLVQKKYSWLRERFVAGSESNALVRTLVGHRDAVTSVTITFDSRLIMSGSWDRTCKLWDLGGRCIRTFNVRDKLLCRVAISPDGRFAVVPLGHDNLHDIDTVDVSGHIRSDKPEIGTLRVWDTETGATIRVLKGHSGLVTSVLIPPNAHFIASTSTDHTVRIWDLNTGALIQTLEGHSDAITSAAATPDQRFLISASSDQTLKLWDLASGDCIREFVGHHCEVRAVAVTPTGRYFVSGDGQGALLVWEIATGQIVCRLKGHTKTVLSIAIAGDGHRVVSASGDGTIRIWEFKTGHSIGVFQGHLRGVSAVVLTHDGRFVISASGDKTLKIWDLEMVSAKPNTVLPERHTASINSVAFSPNSEFALTGSVDGTVKLWRVSYGRVARTLEAHASDVNAVAVTPDGRYGVAVSSDSHLRLWELETGRIVHVIQMQEPVMAVVITPDGRRAVCTSRDQGDGLTVWELETGTALRTLRRNKKSVRCVVVTPNSRQAISGTNDCTLHISDLETGQTVRVLEGHAHLISAVAVTHDGKLAISGSWDCTIKVWNLSSGQTIRTLKGHKNALKGVTITPDNQFIASVSSDCTLRIWHLETGTQVAMLQSHTPLLCCAISPDGNTILAGDEAGGLHVLDWIRPANWKPPMQ